MCIYIFAISLLSKKKKKILSKKDLLTCKLATIFLGRTNKTPLFPFPESFQHSLSHRLQSNLGANFVRQVIP